jgi:hypothetical protein
MEGVILVHFTPKSETVKLDFHMFGPKKEALTERFSSDAEVTGAVQNWLKTQSNFFSDGIKENL